MRVRIFAVFSALLLICALAPCAAFAAAESGRMEVANRSDAGGAFSCDVKLSGGQTRGDVFAVLFAESGQMKRVSEYPAAESVKVALQDVAATDYVKILWTDANQMPLANPIVLRMTANNTAAYEKLAQDLAALNAPETSVNPESSDPYALARLIVSADTLPDLSGYSVQIVSGPDRLHILQFKSSDEAERCEKYLKSSRSVRYSEPDSVILANADMTADGAGTGAAHSWGVSETGIGAYAESLLKREINNPVTVAVVDSGVDAAHSFLKGRLVSGYDFVDGDDVPQDGHGHGTHVAGTLVDCMPGTNVKIMPIRVLDNGAGGTLLNIFLGIRYAASHGANVINLSLSLQRHSDMIEDAIRDAISKNVTVVVAAGNYNQNAAFYCPAHTEEAVTVAAVDGALKRYERSNYGGLVDVAAPGADVESSVPGGKFLKMSGTSMAAPHVSAAAALLISELGSSQTPSQISAAIRGAARTIPKDAGDFEWQRYDGDDFLGAGFLDMRVFIQEPESQFYAHLYADGEMAFQTSRTPDPNKTLVQTYPVSASAGAGEYAAWHSRRAEIRTVTFVDSIRPNSTALWFYGCENLTEVRGVENLDISAVTDMSQMFARCGSLTKLDLSALHTENVRNMRFMFFSCGKLAELDLTGWNTANVADMSDMFNGCAGLKTVYALESFKTDGVWNDVGMFSGCTSLIGGSGTKYDSAHTDKERARIDGGADNPGYFTDKNAPQPSSDIYAVLYSDGELVFQNNDLTDSGRAVTDIYKVENYSYENEVPWNGQHDNIIVVTFANKVQPDSTAYWFYDCKKLKYMDNIENLDTANVTSMSCMFSGCSGLMELDVSHFNTANVTYMTDMFYGCGRLTTLDVSRFDTANVTYMTDMFYGCSGLTVLDVSRFDTANVTDMTDMFYGCSGLTALDVSRFDTANVTDMRWMFSGCSGLTALDVFRFDTANVTSMSHMFSGCSGLTALDVSRFNTANVTNMTDMFSGCSGLTALDVSHFDTANVTSMTDMFYGCNGLTALDVSRFNTVNVTDMRWMFYGCSNLKTIYASDKFTTASVPETEYYSSKSMFSGCASLIGGAGTKYARAHIDKEYARIDGGADNPGYFTRKT